MRALIASGAGRYSDPWHPFSKTSPLIGQVLSEGGFEVAIDDDVDRAMMHLSGIDLLVVNAGDPWRSGDGRLAADAAPPAALAEALRGGMGVLAFHSSLASLRDYPAWAAAIGGMWIPSVSWHPPLAPFQIRGLGLPSGEDIDDFEVTDERYASLQFIGASQVVADHQVSGRREPTAWVRHYGASRIAVNTLGHDERSYDSEGHRKLIKRLAGWVTATGGRTSESSS